MAKQHRKLPEVSAVCWHAIVQVCTNKESVYQDCLADLQAACLKAVDALKLRTLLQKTVAWLGLHSSELNAQQMAQVHRESPVDSVDFPKARCA